jgi:Tfp pilus assembly protein PilF
MHRITHIWTTRAAVLLLAASPSVWAQKPAAGGAATTSIPNAGTATPNTGTLGTMGNIPSTGNTSNFPSSPNSTTRPIFLSGKVMFDDGTPPNINVRIERVCSGNPHLEGHSDSKGNFSFQLGGQTSGFDMDASDRSSNGPLGGSRGGMAPTGRSNPLSTDVLGNCELRAAYPGYRSDVVQLAMRRSLDDPEVGTLILHRLANVQGSTISLTSALAPKAAVKQFEKGEQSAQKNKLEEAEKHLQQATDLYPKYAAAWFALGQVQQRENKPAEARKDYLAAIDADGKYVSPYDQLALLSAQDGKWEEAASYSKQAISLNPVEFPSAFWYNAIANYNLKKSSDALKSAQALVKMDTQHKYPEAENLLAQLSMESRNYAEAATHLRAYLALAPNAKNADLLKRQLSQIDEASAAEKK